MHESPRHGAEMVPRGMPQVANVSLPAAETKSPARRKYAGPPSYRKDLEHQPNSLQSPAYAKPKKQRKALKNKDLRKSMDSQPDV